MRLYCGIDLHSTNCMIVVVDESGKRRLKRRVPNDLGTVLRCLEPQREQIEGVVVESTYNWYWLVDGLMDAGMKLHLANPAAMKQYEGLKHSNDESDAEWLANMLRLGILPVGYIYPKEERPVRDLLRKRASLVQHRTAHLLSIQNLQARNTGGRSRSNEIRRWTDEDVEQLFSNQDLVLPVMASVKVNRVLGEMISEIEKSILARARPRPEFEILQTTSGIGKILAMTIMLETGDIHRFPKVGNYSSYCRCVESRRLSNGKKKGSGNTKNGNKYLAWAYVEAATFAVRHNPKIKRFHERKKAKTKLNVVATKAVAHKLARACYHMLWEQVPFDAEKAFG